MFAQKQILPGAVAIVGPTATGKTDAGIALCRALSGEVVSIDSMQVYRGMDIGTAKPALAERQDVPHHMLDVADPGEHYSVALYRSQADAVILELLSRKKLPVLVGGTGLYLNALTYEMDFAGTQGGGAYRAQLETQAESEAGRQALHDQLAAVDAETAARLHVNDSRRVIRALEIFQHSGKPMSAYQEDFQQHKRLVDPVVIGLTMPRALLYQRINERVEQMLSTGLLGEVRTLYERGIPADAQAMQAIGYKEYFAYFAGSRTLEEATELVKQRSRQYAKRQLTWFGRDARVRWCDVTQYPDKQALHNAILQIVEKQRIIHLD